MTLSVAITLSPNIMIAGILSWTVSFIIFDSYQQKWLSDTKMYWLQLTSYLLFYLLFIINCCEANESIAVLANDVSRDEKKFLIYDVNYGEGFNLRRDVFMRIANTVRILRERGYNYVLVLPPWG
ncbi:unnamed protein product, partial [Wuchereria bancrofti]